MKVIYNNIIPFPNYQCMNLFGILFARKNAKIAAFIVIAIALICMGMNAKYKEDEEAIKNFWKEQKQINDLNNGRDKDK